MFDDISISKNVEWNGKSFAGYIDIRSGVNDDSVLIACETRYYLLE